MIYESSAWHTHTRRFHHHKRNEWNSSSYCVNPQRNLLTESVCKAYCVCVWWHNGWSTISFALNFFSVFFLRQNIRTRRYNTDEWVCRISSCSRRLRMRVVDIMCYFIIQHILLLPPFSRTDAINWCEVIAHMTDGRRKTHRRQQPVSAWGRRPGEFAASTYIWVPWYAANRFTTEIT